MDLIDEFINKVLTEDGSFTMTEEENPFDNERRYSFVQEKVGEAKFVYGECGYSKDFYASMTKKFEIVAVVAQGKVYFINMFFFGFWLKEVDDYEKAEAFSSCVVKINDYVRGEIWPVFFGSLEGVETQEEKECRRRARNALLSGNPDFWISEPEGIGFDEKDVTEILCGLMNVEEEAKRRLEDEREDWLCTKARIDRMKELMASPDELCQKWELEIAEGLRSVKAVNVTVEFKMNGKTALGKMEPGVISNTLMEGSQVFSTWNFATSIQGEKVFEALGASDRFGKNPLKCEHISRITYGRKVLYERVSE